MQFKHLTHNTEIQMNADTDPQTLLVINSLKTATYSARRIVFRIYDLTMPREGTHAVPNLAHKCIFPPT